MTDVGSFGFEGMAELQAALRASPAIAIAELGGAMWREANNIMTDAKGQTPVKWGIMRASGTVFPPEINGTDVEVVLGFGGASQSYDVAQHERADYHHTVGKDHFLSDPFEAHAVHAEATIGADLASRPFFLGLPK